MQPCISTAENLSLSQIPDAKEIKDVVWEMNAMKALGPDGLLGIFFSSNIGRLLALKLSLLLRVSSERAGY